MASDLMHYSLGAAARARHKERLVDVLEERGYSLVSVEFASKDNTVGVTVIKGGIRRDLRYDAGEPISAFLEALDDAFPRKPKLVIATSPEKPTNPL